MPSMKLTAEEFAHAAKLPTLDKVGGERRLGKYFTNIWAPIHRLELLMPEGRCSGTEGDQKYAEETLVKWLELLPAHTRVAIDHWLETGEYIDAT